jgi:lysophospholipase L1-like esterase
MSKKKKAFIGISVVSILMVVLLLLQVFVYVLPERKERLEWEEFIKTYRQAKIDSYITENEKYDDYEVDVAFLGDSLTDGYDLQKYYPQYTVVNRGIGGDTTFDLEGRLQVSAYDLKPKVVVMLIGANNFQTMFENYERIVSGLKDNLPDTEIVLLSLTSMSKEWGKNNNIACFNNVKIRKVAEKYGCTYVDLFYPLLNTETNGIYDEYTTDGGHLTPKGYEVMTAIITPVLESLL